MDTPNQQQSNTQQFIDDLIDQKFANHQTEITPEVREELKKDLIRRLDDFVMAKIIAAFSDEDVAAFETLLKEGKSREELQQFAEGHIPDFTNFVTDAFLEFQTVYLGTT